MLSWVLEILLILNLFLVIVFRDVNTPDPFIETFPGDDGQAARESKPNHVYMDSVVFGLGMCCTQVGQQYENYTEGLLSSTRLI